MCDRALLGAYSENKLQIDRKIVRKAANEVLADELQPPRTRRGPEAPNLRQSRRLDGVSGSKRLEKHYRHRYRESNTVFSIRC